MSIDKNKAVLTFLADCPQIKDNPLYFNFINAKDNHNQMLPMANDKALERKYVDGSQKRRYSFTLLTFKSITELALVQEEDISNENIDDMLDAQGLIDWIDEQNEARHYPNFGEKCIIEEISTTTDNPRFEGVNPDVTPELGLYSVTIQIDYIDYSKAIWS